VSGRLVIFSGLPGVGKSAIARELARRLGATYVRIDTIEQVLTDAGAGEIVRADPGLGYLVAYALAADNLGLGQTVVGDSVNGLAVTRQAWRAIAANANAEAVDVEVTCSDAAEHRRRVEQRRSDIAGLKLPTWTEIQAREFQPWDRPPIVVDTAGRDLASCVAELEAALATS
jgi:predicted kinase